MKKLAATAQAIASVAWGLATPSLFYMISLLLQIYPESVRVRSHEPSISSFLVPQALYIVFYTCPTGSGLKENRLSLLVQAHQGAAKVPPWINRSGATRGAPVARRIPVMGRPIWRAISFFIFVFYLFLFSSCHYIYNLKNVQF